MFPAITLLDPGTSVARRGNPVLVQSFARFALHGPPHTARSRARTGACVPGVALRRSQTGWAPRCGRWAGFQRGNPAKPCYSTSTARNWGSPVRFANAT